MENIFKFDSAYYLGKVREVDTHKVLISVLSDEQLRRARVGQLVAISSASAVNNWLIGMVSKVVKSVSISDEVLFEEDQEGADLDHAAEVVINTVKLSLLGSVNWVSNTENYIFSRSISSVPEIDTDCYVLKDRYLEDFMGLLSHEKRDNSLQIGHYTLDKTAEALIDGNKFFQRHAAILGSTGSGKSCAVASILERASSLKSSNIIVFDLHGEYRDLSYAKHLRIPGPEDLNNSSDELLFLPYWMLNSDELQALFIDRSEFSAHNQVMKFQDLVIDSKRNLLLELDKKEVLSAFTLNSPIPFDIKFVIEKLTELNEERVPGAAAGKFRNGPFNGEFSRLLIRMNSKLSDRRYGFIFQAPEEENNYDSMAKNFSRILDFSSSNSQIKVIDFSDVPSDVLPIVLALVVRTLYQIQFWTKESDRHPLAIVCDEAHLYLPQSTGLNPSELRSLESFEKIAKEGRKYGISLLVVSQRPSDVSSTILSQCNNIMALRLTNHTDQMTVRKLMPESLEGLLESLPIMDVGEALIVGDSVLLPSRIKITPPKEFPLSSTIDFWSRWNNDFAQPDISISIENMRKQSRR